MTLQQNLNNLVLGTRVAGVNTDNAVSNLYKLQELFPDKRFLIETIILKLDNTDTINDEYFRSIINESMTSLV